MLIPTGGPHPFPLRTGNLVTGNRPQRVARGHALLGNPKGVLYLHDRKLPVTRGLYRLPVSLPSVPPSVAYRPRELQGAGDGLQGSQASARQGVKQTGRRGGFFRGIGPFAAHNSQPTGSFNTTGEGFGGKKQTPLLSLFLKKEEPHFPSSSRNRQEKKKIKGE